MQQPNLALTAIQESLPPPKHKRSTDEVFNEPQRLHKVLASCGFGSRRAMEDMIIAGRITVNRLPAEVGQKVGPGDEVRINGELVKVRFSEPRPRILMYHKPTGEIVTRDDPEGRPTVFESLPEDLPRVVSIGRLDFNTEGLLLLTNDGKLARHMELPATGWLRRYRVRAHGRVTQAELDKIKDGIEIEGVRYGAIEATVDSVQGANIWLTIGIREGKNREVRKVLSTFGLDVNRLIRISFGPFQLLDLAPGAAENVKRRVLADQLGEPLASELGLTGPDDVERERRAARGKPKRGGEGG